MVLAWVNTIALNVHRRLQRNEPAWQALPELGTTPRVNLAAIDLARILKICGPGDRAFLRYQMNGLSPREIAKMRGVPESAIRIRLLRARRAARRRVELGRCPAISNAGTLPFKSDCGCRSRADRSAMRAAS